MKKSLVSIIVVNWNGGEVYLQTLKSLSKITYPSWELIVIDNGSHDGSEKFHTKFKLPAQRIEFIQNKENRGFAPANNQGFLVSKGKHILLLNNDTQVEPDFLTVMMEKMTQDKTIGAMQPKIYLMDKKGYLDNAGSFMTPTGFLNHWGFMEKDSVEFDRERDIFSAKGACLLTRKDVIEKVGLFDDTFQSYFEETDFCWRVWLAGWRVIYYPKTHIHHKLGYTSQRMSQFQVNYNSIKNRNLSLFKNLSKKNLFLIYIPHLILIKGLGLYYLVRLQKDKAGMIYRALWWNFTHMKDAIIKRKAVQKLRKQTDEEIFTEVMERVNIVDMFKHFQRVEKNFK